MEKPAKPLVNKEVFIKLAQAYINQDAYEDDVYEAVVDAAKRHNVTHDFLGNMLNTDVIMGAVLDVLGDDFSYFYFECDADFEKFSENVDEDGIHPEVRDLSDLYDFATGTLAKRLPEAQETQESKEPQEEKVLKRNRVRCKRCGDIIESKSVHDAVRCSCGAVFTDGGTDYIHRGGDPRYIEPLDEFEEVDLDEEE